MPSYNPPVAADPTQDSLEQEEEEQEEEQELEEEQNQVQDLEEEQEHVQEGEREKEQEQQCLENVVFPRHSSGPPCTIETKAGSVNWLLRRVIQAV